MRRDYEIGQHTLRHSSSGTAAATGISGKIAGREAPDIFSKIEIDCDVHLREQSLNPLRVGRGNSRKLDEDWCTNDQRSLCASL